MNTEGRPELNKDLDSRSFLNWYWLKEELAGFCKACGIPASGSKKDLTGRIAHYLDTGKVMDAPKTKRSASAVTSITLDSLIEPDFVCSEVHRAFFKEQIGASFSFNVAFQKWLKTNTGKTYKEAVEAYHEILTEKKKGKTVIDKQFEYNTYVRDFFEANKGRSLDEAIRCWRYKKSMPGHNRYEDSDLEALGHETIRTNYEKWYEGDGYYWGTEPAGFCDELIALCPPSKDKKVLDIGCGEGKDAVYMAQKGYDVTAFDLTENGIRKTIQLAAQKGVDIKAYVDDINIFETEEQFDIIYSSGTVQYLFDENKENFFNKLEKITRPDGIVFFNVFVEKSFLELPPDWDKEEKMWKSGELFTYFADWKFERIDEVIFEDNSGGIPHYHCMDTIICRKVSAG